MGRSGVLTGKIDARDRAKVRGRRNRAPAAQPDPYDQLAAWLKASEVGSSSDEELQRLDTDAFVMDTGHVDLAPEERLRQLAIFVERRFGYVADALDRIYEAGLRLNPSDFVLWHSRGISAKLASFTNDEAERARRFEKLALRCFLRAHELAPTDADLAYAIGKWHYDHGEEDGAEWFEKAIELDPKHGWALLFRAHCLHDRKRWAEAVEAYLAVPLDTFDGPTSWRVDIVLEAQALCRLQAGDREGAIADFERLIQRLSKEPKRADMLDLRHVSHVVKGPLQDELGEAYSELAKRLATAPIPRR